MGTSWKTKRRVGADSKSVWNRETVSAKSVELLSERERDRNFQSSGIIILKEKNIATSIDETS